MSDEQEIKVWEQMNDEPPLWYRRFERYRLMKPVRSIAATFQDEETAKNSDKQRKKPVGDWYIIANQWQWEERAAAYDAYQIAQEETIITQERTKILKLRYALMHKRVEQLDRLAQKLLNYIDDDSRLWLLDVKSIGTGPNAERVDLVQFNDALVREARACFADIASELGERAKVTKAELTGKNGGPLEVEYEVDWGGGTATTEDGEVSQQL